MQNPEQIKSQREIMQANFFSLFKECDRSKVSEIFENIAREHGSDKRHYHDLDHVHSLLQFLEKHDQKIEDMDSVQMAAWFHDVVYDTEKHDNESKSAEYAEQCLEQLEINRQTIEKVMAYIQATAKHEQVVELPDSKYFLDGDLAILGSDDDIYDRYASKIRQEYSWVPENEYKNGRKQVLENFLKRDRIYFSDEANEKFEIQARKNIEREIKNLTE